MTVDEGLVQRNRRRRR